MLTPELTNLPLNSFGGGQTNRIDLHKRERYRSNVQ
jgi:hypothetical protein